MLFSFKSGDPHYLKNFRGLNIQQQQQQQQQALFA